VIPAAGARYHGAMRERTTPAGRAAAACLAALAAAACAHGCAGNTRAHPLADWELYEEPAGLFSFRYPAPPWELISESPSAVHLEIAHRGVIDRPMPVENLDVAVAGAAQDLDAFVAQRMAAVMASGSVLLCAEPPCVPDVLETNEGDRALGFSHRTADGTDAREYYVSGTERIVSAIFIGVRDVEQPEYDVLAESVVPHASE